MIAFIICIISILIIISGICYLSEMQLVNIHTFRDNQTAEFGIKYSKHLHLDNQCILTFSFWKYDLEFDWQG